MKYRYEKDVYAKSKNYTYPLQAYTSAGHGEVLRCCFDQ